MLWDHSSQNPRRFWSPEGGVFLSRAAEVWGIAELQRCRVALVGLGSLGQALPWWLCGWRCIPFACVFVSFWNQMGFQKKKGKKKVGVWFLSPLSSCTLLTVPSALSLHTYRRPEFPLEKLICDKSLWALLALHGLYNVKKSQTNHLQLLSCPSSEYPVWSSCGPKDFCFAGEAP